MKFIRLSVVFLVLLLLWASLEGCRRGQRSENKEAETVENSEEGKDEKTDDQKGGDEGEEEDETALPVETHVVGKGEIASYHLANSTMEAEQAVDVYSQVSGLIVDIFVEEGDYVRKGQKLAKVEEVDYALVESKQRETYIKLEKDFERIKKMYADELLSQEEHENYRHNYEQAKIDWEQAKLELERTNVVAPISGVISERVIKEGQRVQVYARLFSIVDMNSIVAKVHIPEKEVSSLRVGQNALITTDSFPDREFAGKIIRISPVIDPSSGTIKVTIGLNDKQSSLKPGMFVNTKIITEVHTDTVMVPKKAVIYDGGLPVVYRVRENEAEKIILKTGFSNARTMEVLEGLEEGDIIVVVGQTGLRDKSRVKTVNGEVKGGEKEDSAE